jgi:outer membrane protein assembly factor BamD
MNTEGMPMNPRPAHVALVSALLLAGSFGCRKPKTVKQDPKKQATAASLLADGKLYLQHGRWDEARKQLRFIEENLPNNEVFPETKLLLGDSYFYASTSSLPEALVEYQSFLSYFPKHPMRDYALYHVALCHYASIANAERDQASTRKAIDAFQQLLRESPGSVYVVDVKAKILQCWRRLAESELMVGIFYVKSHHWQGAERRIKGLMETYPEYVDRERAYYFLAEAMNNKEVDPEIMTQWEKDYLAKLGKEDFSKLDKEERAAMVLAGSTLRKEEIAKYRKEARASYQKLVESYPASVWAGRAKDRLVEMGQAGVKEELDS